MKQQQRSQQPQPFYESPSAPETHGRRLLLISYVFPPTLASGSLRWQKLSHFAAERGWGLDVITLAPSHVAAPDFDRLADLSPGTRVFGVGPAPAGIEQAVRSVWRALRRVRAPKPPAANATDASSDTRGNAVADSVRREQVRWDLRSRRGLIRAYSAWLHYWRDGRWARDAASLALRVYEPGAHRAVVTSGPPHMAHDAGRRVARVTGLPFVMDMRDPWSLAERLAESQASPLWLMLARQHERRAVKRAALVVANTEPFARAMTETYPQASERIVAVMNGADEGALPSCQPPRADRFVLAYAGEIYIDRNPRLLFRAAARVVREFALTPEEFGFEFIGDVRKFEGTPLTQMAAEEGIPGFVTVGPPRPHREALQFLGQAAMLVSLPQDSDLAIPAKIFEYMRFDAWLVALATPHSATGLVLRDSGADVVGPHDIEELTRVLRTRFLQFRQGVRPTALAPDATSRFSRRHQATVLFDAIERCTSLAPSQSYMAHKLKFVRA